MGPPYIRLIQDKLNKFHHINYEVFHHACGRLNVSDDLIDMSYYYQQEWKKRITTPDLTNETKEYILNEIIDDESLNDPLMSKELINQWTFRGRHRNDALDAVYNYYIQQRRLRDKQTKDNIKTDLGICFKTNSKQNRLLKIMPEFSKAQNQTLNETIENDLQQIIQSIPSPENLPDINVNESD